MEVRAPVSRRQGRTLALAGVGAFLAVWFLLAYFGEYLPEAIRIPRSILPTPIDVLNAIPVLHTEEALVRSAGYSLYRVTMGFLLSAAVAIPLGLLMGTFPAIKKFFSPLIDPLRFLPISALVPLFL